MAFVIKSNQIPLKVKQQGSEALDYLKIRSGRASYLSSDLVAALSGLNVHDFSHGVGIVVLKSLIVCLLSLFSQLFLNIGFCPRLLNTNEPHYSALQYCIHTPSYFLAIIKDITLQEKTS